MPNDSIMRFFEDLDEVVSEGAVSTDKTGIKRAATTNTIELGQ